MYLFISQPMNGRDFEEIKTERKQIKEKASWKLCDNDLRVLPSFFDTKVHDDSPLKGLGKAIAMMQDADVVAFAEGWENSRGCAIEHECAVRYGKKIIYV